MQEFGPGEQHPWIESDPQWLEPLAQQLLLLLVAGAEVDLVVPQFPLDLDQACCQNG